MASAEEQRARSWAKKNGLVLCSADALAILATMINDVALGIQAVNSPTGEVSVTIDKRFDYQEMMGLKLLISCDQKYWKGDTKSE